MTPELKTCESRAPVVPAAPRKLTSRVFELAFTCSNIVANSVKESISARLGVNVSRSAKLSYERGTDKTSAIAVLNNDNIENLCVIINFFLACQFNRRFGARCASAKYRDVSCGNDS